MPARAAEPQTNRAGRTLIVLMVALLTLMPTYSALAEIYATPVAEPTPASTPAEETNESTPQSVVASPAIELIAVATPEANMHSRDSVRRSTADDGSFEMPGDKSLDECKQSASIVSPGQPIVITCETSFEPRISAVTTTRVTRPPSNNQLTASMSLSPRDGQQWPSGKLDHDESGESKDLGLGLLSVGTVKGTLTIEIKALENYVPGRTFELAFDLCRWALVGFPIALLQCVEEGSISVEVRTPPRIVQSDVWLECSPDDSISLGLKQSSTSECVVETLQELGETQVRIDSITTQVTGGGDWSIILDPKPATDTSIDLQADDSVKHPLITPPLLTGTNGSAPRFPFNIRLYPEHCEADNEVEIDVSVSMTAVRGDDVGNQIDSNEDTVKAEFTAPNATSEVQIIEINDPDPVQFNMLEDQDDLTGSFKVRLSVSGCGERQVSATMTPFTGPSSTVPILDNASPGATVPIGDVPMSVKVDDIDDLSTDPANPTQLIVGSSDGLEATVEHSTLLTYTVPANTPVGTYESTIEVTTSDAP